MFHILTVPSSDDDTSWLSSGMNSTVLTLSSCPRNSATNAPERGSYTRTVPSAWPTAVDRPSGKMSRAVPKEGLVV